MARTTKDLTGQRFGKLAVTGFAGYGQNSRQRAALWECQCDCGNTCTVQAYLLKNGRRKSCGCIRSVSYDLIGRKFGSLTVIGNDDSNDTTLQKVICRCECGREKSIPTRKLKNGLAVDCGCKKAARQSTQNRQMLQYNELQEQKRVEFQKGNLSGICTLDDWVYVWLREILPNVVKGTTIRMYTETMYHHILPVLGNQTLKGITEDIIRMWVYKLHKTPVPGTQNGQMTEGTIRNVLSVLSGCMRDAQKYGLIERNPCLESAWTLKTRNVGEHQAWLTEEQLHILEPVIADYRDEKGYPIGIGFQLVLYAGVTLSEAAALRWKDVSFREKNIRVEYFVALKREEERMYELEPLSGRKCREVPVPDLLIDRLEEVHSQYKGTGNAFVLGNSEHEPVRMDRMRAALMRKSEACGLGMVTPRMLRDTYAMKAVHAGAGSDMIAELMGFASSQQVIRRYMPKASVNKRELIRKMFGE